MATLLAKMDLIKRYTLLMLSRRGYDTTITESTDTITRIGNVLIVFVPDSKVSIATIKFILATRIDNELVVVVHAKKLTSDARNKILADTNIETFTFEEMSFDLLDIIPMHTRVTPVPLEWKRLPVLLKSDAAVRYFGFKPKEVIKIVEDDATISYRRVC